jgi:phosphoribosyl-ATP pyrophosphohydrolase
MKPESRQLVTDETFEDIMEEFAKHINKVLERKGRFGFISMTDIYGKLSEEVYETLKAMHEKNKDEFSYELFDVAVVALWGAMSLRQREVNK